MRPALAMPAAFGCQGFRMVFFGSQNATMSSICIIFYSAQAGLFFRKNQRFSGVLVPHREIRSGSGISECY